MTDIDTRDPAADALRTQLRRLRRRNDAPRPRGAFESAIDTGPANAHEAITRQMVLALGDDLREIRARLDWLFYALVGTVLLDLVGRVLDL